VPIGNYVYISNQGAEYQVAIPEDFADALGMSPASGSEPYLDTSLSPRFSTWYNTIAGSRSAIVGDTTTFGSLPSNLVVDGLEYVWRSSYGESVPPTAAPLLASPQGAQGAPGPTGPEGPTGPQGPPGPPTAGEALYVALASNISLSTSLIDVCSVTVANTADYFLDAVIQGKTVVGGLYGEISDSAFFIKCAGITSTDSSNYCNASLGVKLTLNAGDTLYLRAKALSNSGSPELMGIATGTAYTFLRALQVSA